MPRIVRIHENGGPEVLKIEEVEVPPPQDREISIQVKALGLNRSEVMFRRGQHIETPRFPARLGYEAAGTIIAVGKEVDGFTIGDVVSVIPPPSVTRWGVYGEVATVPAEYVVKHPERLSFEQAAALWMQNITAYGGLVDIGRLTKGESALILAGSSSVGLASIRVARAVGAISIVTTRTEAKKQALLDFGADHVIVTEAENLVERIREITSGQGVRVVFDPVGGPGVDALTQAMAQHGILIAYGALSGQPTPFPLASVVAKGLTFRGYTFKEVVLDSARLVNAKRFILEGIATGALDPVIDKVFKFDQIRDAHRYLESNEQFGKIVVTV